MYVNDKDGKRVYTLKKVLEGKVTKSAHPARFSPDDKYSRYVRPIASTWHRPPRIHEAWTDIIFLLDIDIG